MPATVESPGPRDFEGGNTRRAFVDSMLKAEQVSAEITRKMDGVRSHRVKELQDLKETDRKAERAIKSELERKQQEVEGILKKKKDEEHLKRLEFEEQRIKEENEKMKRDAEEKRKRDLEDLRLQELLKLKEESKPSAVAPSPTPARKKEAKSEEESEEELRRQEEEKIIQLGRDEHHKEFERRRKAAEEKKEAENPAPKKKETTRAFSKPTPIRQAPISEFLRPAPSLNSGSQKSLVQEKARTLAVVEEREKGFTSFNVFQANKQMQKPKYQTFADQDRGQHSSSSSSSSRRWENVSTGLVRDRATAYLHQDPPSHEPSPRVARKSVQSEPHADAPWRKQEDKDAEPTLALLNVSVEKVRGSSPVHASGPTAPGKEVSPGLSISVDGKGRGSSPAMGTSAVVAKLRGTSPALGSAVAGLTVTMAELESLGARVEVPVATSSAADCAVKITAVSQAAVSVKEAAKGVREVAQTLLSTIASPPPPSPPPPLPQASASGKFPEREEWGPSPSLGETTDEEDDFGFEDEQSMGIDLPQGLDPTSGNVTPTPTTGELEELSISSAEQQTVVEDIRSSQGSRATPLKSLLKKPSVDLSSDSESEDGKVSPKKVHFSEIDQVKLMSQDSIASMLSSETGSEAGPGLVTNSVPAALVQPTYLLASPDVARVSSLMADRQEELTRALQD